MKKINLFRMLSLSAIIATTMLVFVACEKEDDDDMDDPQTYSLSGNASGSQEVPAVTTSATGSLSGSYNSATNTLNYNITWTGLSNVVSGIHFHGPALVGAEAGVIHGLTITTNGVAGTSTGSLIIADSTESHLLAGKLYYNIHTALNPDGEIRGQVTATAE
jgi:hypothetical protein